MALQGAVVAEHADCDHFCTQTYVYQAALAIDALGTVAHLLPVRWLHTALPHNIGRVSRRPHPPD
eukprot:16448543-Heterocapsa_arctica.AAC.1